jgi:hypothetical protein
MIRDLATVESIERARAFQADPTPRGRTSTGRAVGACGACGTGLATEGVDAGDVGTCPHCGARVRLAFVYGEHSDQPCNGACMGATGPLCSCACGGTNHSRWNLRIELVPVYDQEKARAAQSKQRATHAARVERKRLTAEERAREGRARLVAGWPVLAALDTAEYDPAHGASLGDFMADMRRAFLAGDMSDRQADAAARAIERERAHAARRAGWEAADAAALAAGVRVPTGRVVFTGEIVAIHDDKINQHVYYAPTVWEMTIRTVEGWRVKGTIPAALMGTVMSAGGKPSDLRGRTVTLRAYVKPGTRSPLFGYYSRPYLTANGPATDVSAAPTPTPTPTTAADQAPTPDQAPAVVSGWSNHFTSAWANALTPTRPEN